MNPNKTISVNSRGIVVSFVDTNKHFFVKFENQDIRTTPKRIQEIEEPVFNKTQQKMYSEALYGLNVYTEQEISRMPKSRVVTIMNRFHNVQKYINQLKQEIVNDRVDSFLTSLFPKSPITKAFVETKGTDDSIRSKFSFKELDLDQKTIATKLVKVGLLPKNFFNLV